MVTEVPKVERLVNLVIALLETRRPLTLAEIKRRTGYYEGSEASARRKFERDKDELRALGVPIELQPSEAMGPADGYIIDRANYEQPDVELTDEEAAALAVVVRMTAEPDARLAMARVAARSPDDEVADPSLSLGARLSLGEGPYAELSTAVVERRRVRFTYRRNDGSTGRRDVAPYAVLTRGGAWYLVGHDASRDDVRAFRLDRIVGPAEVAEQVATYEIPDDLDPRQNIRGPVVPTEDVLVAVAPELAFEAQRRGGQPTGDEVDGLVVHAFGTADRNRLATWIVGHADGALAIAPPELRDDVVARLRAVREALS